MHLSDAVPFLFTYACLCLSILSIIINPNTNYLINQTCISNQSAIIYKSLYLYSMHYPWCKYVLGHPPTPDTSAPPPQSTPVAVLP